MQERAREGRKSFVAYLTAGDPNLEETPGLVAALVRGGADVIELGIPFSDPLADGPTNQRAAERALAAGASLDRILDSIATIRKTDTKTPLVVFSYLNPIFHMGFARFAERASQVGADAVLVVDLPPEEAESYRHAMQAKGLDTVFLASPTSDVARLQVINQQSTGFVYYVSRTGVTGVQSQLSDTLASEMQRVRSEVSRPVMVGFGISGPEQAVTAAALGDGIIIGSAIVKLIEEGKNPQDRVERVERFTHTIRQALDQGHR
jgi:tryptophan synthase alpha chain